MKALFNSFLLLILSVTVLGQQDPQSHYGQIKTIDGFKSAHVDARNIYIWLPSNYTPVKKYAVLYMHDGQM
ncbi:MAG TPA: alpha/beta hydrolase, partial [Bacteroidales bacterium]|nr:alpha/beta hydrolase [Bacteroidales bacterium]